MTYMMYLVAECIFSKYSNNVNCKLMDLNAMLVH